MVPAVLRLRVPADAATLSRHIGRVRTFLNEHGLDAGTTEDIRLCVHECCANSIRHSGSRDDIDVSLTLDDRGVTILVVDNGCGLDADTCDPRRVPDPHATRGRGLFLVARLMDDVDVSVDGGTEVRMTKRL